MDFLTTLVAEILSWTVNIGPLKFYLIADEKCLTFWQEPIGSVLIGLASLHWLPQRLNKKCVLCVCMEYHKVSESLIYTWFSTIASVLQFKVLSCALMKAIIKYLAGLAGPSGYGSKSTAEQVTRDCSSSSTFLPSSHLTAIITGKYWFASNMSSIQYILGDNC